MPKTASYVCAFVVILQGCFALVPFQVCSRRDPNFSNCLKLAIEDALLILENGLPEYNIPSIQPIRISSWMVPAKLPLTYDQVFTNSEFFNYPLTVIKNVTAKIDDSNFFLDLTAHNPEIVCESNYKFDNAIINGEDLSSEGKLVFIYRNMEFRFNLTGTIVSNGGGKNIEITGAGIDIKSMERFSIKFNGSDTEKLEKLNKFYHDNAQNLVDTELDVYEKAYAAIFKDIANTIFSKFSFDTLFPE
ncbi:hypothetical protein RI129_012471 [Pyrocoelia pectoralis]|uniref:Uncharacterized protein n=1 Tax=Pyrocoelia pectoralis TaxID=417401 RepID=A0AAN7V3V1_9COLE